MESSISEIRFPQMGLHKVIPAPERYRNSGPLGSDPAKPRGNEPTVIELMLSRSKRIPEPLARSELFHRKLRMDRSPVLVTGRLEKLLAEHEEIEADDWVDRAALDCSPAFERHRRYQSARHRELMRTLETLRKMRKEEFGTGNGKSGVRSSECGMRNGQGGMADDECQMANAECQMADDECQVSGGEPMAEGSSGPIVGHHSNRVIDDSTNDKIGILSYEDAHAPGQQGQGDGVGQCLPDDVTTPQKAPNKANLESNQNLNPQELESETAEAEGRE